MSKMILNYAFLMLMLLALPQALKSQITLEHTFVNERLNFNMNTVNGQQNYIYENEASNYPENCYYFSETVNNSYHVRIYSPDYSLLSNTSYNFTPPLGYKISQIMASKKLFYTDDNYEFFIIFEKIAFVGYDNEYNKAILYDMNGNILKDFGMGGMIYVYPYTLHVVNNQCKLLLYRYIYDNAQEIHPNTEVYFVRGTAAAINTSTSSSLIPYPNPSNSIITLPYQLKKGDFSVMRILNSNGQLIETKQIGYNFDKILLDVSTYAKGLYIYQVNGVSNKFIVE